MIMCTDQSRRVLKGRFSDGTTFVDSGGKHIALTISKPTREKINRIYSEALQEKMDEASYGVIDRRYKSHQVALELAKLAKELAKTFGESSALLSKFIKNCPSFE